MGVGTIKIAPINFSTTNFVLSHVVTFGTVCHTRVVLGPINASPRHHRRARSSLRRSSSESSLEPVSWLHGAPPQLEVIKLVTTSSCRVRSNINGCRRSCPRDRSRPIYYCCVSGFLSPKYALLTGTTVPSQRQAFRSFTLTRTLTMVEMKHRSQLTS